MRKRNLPLVILVVALALIGEDVRAHRQEWSGPAVAGSAGYAGTARQWLMQAAAGTSVSTFAGNAQHTAIFEPAAQDLNAIHWSVPIDLNHSGTYAHYGAPLITSANTVLVPVKTAADGFRIDAFDGAVGSAKYSLTTDYILPSHNWVPTYQPVLAAGPVGTRLYYPGAGGTIYYIDDPDSDSHGSPVQEVFYTTLADYQANAAAYNSTVFVNTPITADDNGTIFFGFRVQGTAPAPLNTTQSGFARIDPDGNATYVLAGTATTDVGISRDSHNSTPALSNDQTTLYVVAKSSNTSYYGYLLGLDTTTLSTKYKVFLKDPRNGNANNAGILDDSTASPTVAPDDDVYFGVFGNPSNGSRGFLLRFSGDLTVEKTPGGFGWDYTAAIVPKRMVPSYTGASPYLIFAKYNNYANVGGDSGDGVNKIALLDPNATEVDPHASSNGMLVMREVLTVAGPTPDAENDSIPDAVREWCINTAAVNPATNSIFMPSEDGHIYRWNLATNSLSQFLQLTAGVGEPYVPTVIGPDGTVYTLNGGTLFALGGLDGVAVTLSSSSPDVRTGIAGQPITLTATVSSTGASGDTPTGTITFEDTVYFVLGPGDLGSTTMVLASGVPLDGTGNATYTTSALGAGSHFIAALYSGDSNVSAGSVGLVQKIHGHGSSTTLSSSSNPSNSGQTVLFTATVASAPSGSDIPTGMVTLQEGTNVLAQVSLNSGGVASFSTSAVSVGSHTITAVYDSDTRFASSSGDLVQVVEGATPALGSFVPTGGPVGASVTINGTNFTGATNVTFNGISTIFTVNTPIKITATVPTGATTGLISVTTPDGTATSASKFTVAPRITSFAPPSGAVGASVTITGANFTGTTAVKFNGTSAAFSVNLGTQISATVPASATTGSISVTTSAGTATSSSSFTVAPRVSSFSPASGPVGTSVIINGTNFTGATAVTFNGTSATFTVNTAVKITATAPAGATTGRISVTTPTGTGTSTGNFTMTPAISSFTPTGGAVGISVTVTGTTFTGVTSVKFNGTSATVFHVDSSSQITADVPANATTGPISVTTGVGTATSSPNFVVAPRITRVLPTSGPIGTSVTINGANFTGAIAVTFNGASAAFTVNTATTITTMVPAGASTGLITIMTAAGTASSATSFTVMFLPTITGFTPTSGGVGISVIITGTNFTGTTAVKFNGTSASSTTNTSSQITAAVPTGATTGPITATNAAGTATSSSNFTVAPRVIGFTPTSGSVGASVIINGANFTGATVVKFNGIDASYIVNSAIQITASVPAAATTGKISVTTAAGTGISTGNVTVKPAITNVTPTSGVMGTPVTIAGTTFTGASSVKFNGSSATVFHVDSSTQITANVPANATTGPITVTTVGGTATSANSFTVAPRITSFTPASGAAGTSVTINGANFTATTAVQFNGTSATFTVNTAVRITATVLSGATTGNIQVTTDTGAATSASVFTVP